ncbi:flagellar protein FlaG [Shewanella sp. TB4-MNA-CIBAN-0142]|uniref:flagellar protein FlaG n=1 Tax=Shewanella sp. TB4-MNA-CIBAN-0142 TaxID=3140464 RepID=UPI003327F59C
MDVNVTALSSNLRNDGLSHLVDKPSNIANGEQPQQGMSRAGDLSRSVEKVNQVAKVDSEELKQAVNDIAASMNVMQKGLSFKIDEESGVQIVKVIDVKTGDLIRQIPNEEALDIAQKLNEVAGLLMKTEV